MKIKKRCNNNCTSSFLNIFIKKKGRKETDPFFLIHSFIFPNTRTQKLFNRVT